MCTHNSIIVSLWLFYAEIKQNDNNKKLFTIKQLNFFYGNIKLSMCPRMFAHKQALIEVGGCSKCSPQIYLTIILASSIIVIHQYHLLHSYMYAHTYTFLAEYSRWTHTHLSNLDVYCMCKYVPTYTYTHILLDKISWFYYKTSLGLFTKDGRTHIRHMEKPPCHLPNVDCEQSSAKNQSKAST